MTSYQDSRCTPALQRCLKLRKLAERQHSTFSAPIDISPPPLELPCMEELPPTSYTTINASNSKSKTEDSYTKDPAKRAAAKKRSLLDAQELIGRILDANPSIYNPSPIDIPRINTKIHPPPKPPSLVAFSQKQPQAPMAELPLLIAAILDHPVITPGPTSFQFQQTPAAASHNAKILGLYHNNLALAISADGNSPLQYGSEFRPKSILEPLLRYHPNWPAIDELLTQGCTFLAPPLSEPDRLNQIDLALTFGNHKGALRKPQQLINLLHDDISHGPQDPRTSVVSYEYRKAKHD